ncbi:heterokaryon incompatibility, partial [Paraphoma chrysanthemicola]
QSHYVALSHRWATSCCPHSLKTTNLQQYQASIPTSQLPKNFIDAIAITEVLGLSYLWIDCLCIIQDSTSDWEIESANMDAVYLNATVTIAAGAA